MLTRLNHHQSVKNQKSVRKSPWILWIPASPFIDSLYLPSSSTTLWIPSGLGVLHFERCGCPGVPILHRVFPFAAETCLQPEGGDQDTYYCHLCHFLSFKEGLILLSLGFRLACLMCENQAHWFLNPMFCLWFYSSNMTISCWHGKFRDEAQQNVVFWNEMKKKKHRHRWNITRYHFFLYYHFFY